MEKAEYDAMARLENSLWWYLALRNKVLCSLLRFLDPDLVLSVLDAGCGTGGLLKLIGERFPAWKLHGIDYSDHAVASSRTITSAGIIQGTVSEMPYGPDSFDAVISLDVMYHQQVNEDRMLSECARILRPGGLLFVNLPAYEWLRSYHDDHIQTARRYTASTLTAAISKHPFQELYCTYWNTILFLPLVIRRKLLPARHEGSDVVMPPAWVNKLFLYLTGCENSWICRGGRLPFGSSVFAIYQRTAIS